MPRNVIRLSLVLAAVAPLAVSSPAGAYSGPASVSAHAAVELVETARPDGATLPGEAAQPARPALNRTASSRTTPKRLGPTKPAAARQSRRSRTPAHTPEWTNPRPGDPGRTLQTGSRRIEFHITEQDVTE